MIVGVLWVVLILSALLIGYHHFVYPLLLGRLASKKIRRQSSNPKVDNHYSPSITIVIPSYNEAEVIAEKLRNLAFVDYPAEKLKIWVLDDGSTDKTAEVAKNILQEPNLQGLQVKVIREPINLGKVAMLNKYLPQVNSDLILLSDASALISIDALYNLAKHMADPQIGVVAGTYRFLDVGSTGEEVYWNYQTRIKLYESAMGATLGVHGALYCIRTALFEKLPEDTINDDFVLPMQIVARGFRCVYEPAIVAVELETATLRQDQHRRKRISAGNFQQVFRLFELLHPKHGAIAFNFLSGKFLRLIMPWCFLIILLSSVALAEQFVLAQLILAMQVLAYGLVVLKQYVPGIAWPKVVNLLHYLIAGHWANAIGTLRYLSGLQTNRWQRVSEVN